MGFPKPGKKPDAGRAELVGRVQRTGVVMECPVQLGLKRDGSDLWTLPLEPVVSVKGGKTLIRRNIAKGQGLGTVKEQWSQDDYEISIDGLLQGDGVFPEQDMSRLDALLKAGQSLMIRSLLTDIVGVGLICISSWDYPATPGLENQAYRISGYSDQDFDLII